MANVDPSRSMRRLGVIAAGTVGFLVGAAGLAAARDAALTVEDSPTLGAAITAGQDAATSTTDDSGSSTTLPDATAVDTTVASGGPTTVPDDDPDATLPDDTPTSSTAPDGPTTTVADSGPSTTLPDDDTGPSTTLPDDDVTGPSTTLPDDDDVTGPSTTLPDDDDDDTTTTTVPSGPSTTVVSLPAPFSQTYVSAGGSIHVSWTGTAFVLHSVDPAAGFSPEIEDQRWDKVRVDFDADHTDSRIEVRLDDTGHIRVRID